MNFLKKPSNVGSLVGSVLLVSGTYGGTEYVKSQNNKQASCIEIQLDTRYDTVLAKIDGIVASPQNTPNIKVKTQEQAYYIEQAPPNIKE